MLIHRKRYDHPYGDSTTACNGRDLMENMVIKRLLEHIDELPSMIKRAYQTASDDQRIFLDQRIPTKLHEIEELARCASIETKIGGMRG